MNSTAMEQIAKYWGMWGARRSSSTASPTIPWAYSGEPSWEEQAFARDAAANLGGCVWPPRSYSCSFCQREFRSAQALGGHMNVHRRDRARLRQCSSPDDVQEAPHDHQPHLETFLYRAISNPSTTTRPSVPAKGDVTSSSTTPPSYLSAISKESKNKVLMSMPMSIPVREEAIDQYDHDDEEESGRAKRRRVDHPSVALPIFVRPVAAAAPAAAPCEGEGLQGVVDHDAEVHKTTASPSSISLLVDRQEVDLELRLGTTPKVT